MLSRSAFGAASKFPINDRRLSRQLDVRGSNIEPLLVRFEEKKLDDGALSVQR